MAKNPPELEKKELTAEEKRKKVRNEIISWILIIAAGFIMALIVNKYVIIKVEIPTCSMENTIMTDDRLIGNRLSYMISKPKRGDIVIFKWPDDRSQNYIKRIIGLPNETVTIKDGKVYINHSETPLEEAYLKEPMEQEEEMEFLVPEGCYFMMGDNRNLSDDARYWESKYVPLDDIIGKPLFRYSPSFGFVK
ncbi:signal peptidase I [Lachnoclostridium phytofermentans]|jgi:signal peptidase I|uniref:signal peptidase I n=1 Tax=Lachnoclostridium phytofermentans TaxID=66219 RepID=UPI0004952103|nr:signal peptidase I [Lachnoclostridium phytofermentans]